MSWSIHMKGKKFVIMDGQPDGEEVSSHETRLAARNALVALEKQERYNSKKASQGRVED